MMLNRKTLALAGGLALACIATIGANAETTGIHVTYADPTKPAVLRCRPQTTQQLTSCAIFLPAGERIMPDKIVADQRRWEVDPEFYGPHGSDSVVFVKERSDEAWLSTTMYLMTDGTSGLYRILVIADPHAPPFAEVRFGRSTADRRATATLHRSQIQKAQVYATAAAAVAKQHQDEDAQYQAILAQPCTAKSDTRYRWNSGPIAPTAVFLDDVGHTCVQFSTAIVALPLPYIGAEEARWHARPGDNMLIIDGRQGRFQLRLDAQTVEIEYVGDKVK